MSPDVWKITRTVAPRPMDPDPGTSPLYGCMHVPDFPVQAIVRTAPELRRRRVAVLDGAFPSFTVVAVNAAARRAGIRVGMTKIQLEQFSGLIVRRRDAEQEEAAHRALLDCAHFFSPRVENTHTGTITLDLNGLSHLWGSARAIAQRLFRAADQLGLEIHVATAANPDTAMLAARAASAITVIRRGEEENKLAELPLQLLPLEPAIAETFQRWGLTPFQDLAALPRVHLSSRLGQEGVRLQRMARGEIHRPLHVVKEKVHFKESMEINNPIDSLEPLMFILSRLLHQIRQRLVARNRTASELRLELEVEPGCANAGTGEATRFIRTIRLPIPTRDPKILLKLFHLDLDAHRPPAPIVGVTLNAEPARPRRIQNNLFLPLAPEPEKLELTLARIGAIAGPDNVGSPELLDTHRPDAFRIRRFRPPASSSGNRLPPSLPASMALRILRPPQPRFCRDVAGTTLPPVFFRQNGPGGHGRGPMEQLGSLVALRWLEPGGVGRRGPVR